MRVLFAASIASLALLACNREVQPVPGWKIAVSSIEVSTHTLNLLGADTSIQHYAATGSLQIQSIPLAPEQGTFLLITISAEKSAGDELSLGTTHATAVVDEAGREFPAVAAGTQPLFGPDVSLTNSGKATLVFDVPAGPRRFKLRLLKESPLISLPDPTSTHPIAR